MSKNTIHFAFGSPFRPIMFGRNPFRWITSYGGTSAGNVVKETDVGEPSWNCLTEKVNQKINGVSVQSEKIDSNYKLLPGSH
jgi:hypothetical protein